MQTCACYVTRNQRQNLSKTFFRADGNLMSYYGTYNGTGYNVTYVQDIQAGYAALTCSEVAFLEAMPESPFCFVPCLCAYEPVKLA